MTVNEDGSLTVEASEIGLEPGQNPDVCLRIGVNGYWFVSTDRNSEGEITGWRYRTQDGEKMLVIND